MSQPSFYEPPDLNPEDEATIKTRLQGEFLRPCEMFQGKPLWPFTPGSKALYHMTLSENDTRLYRVLAFIFIHIRGEIEIKDPSGRVVAKTPATDMEADLASRIVGLVWNDLNLFRSKALSLCDTMTGDDFSDACAIVGKELKLEEESEISATPPDYGSTQKKSPPTSRRKSGGRRSAHRKK